MKKKVFITGVAGFLGSHLADKFLSLGYEVGGIDNMIGGDLDNVPSAVVFREVDCNDRDSYLDMLEGVELVYHCAATAYEGVSVFSPHLVNTNNCNATVGVLSAAIEKRVKRFVYCSSMARYGENQVPFLETMEPKPVDPYGVSKYSAELQIRNLARIHGIEFNIAVPHNIIGSRQKYDDPYRNVASIMINRMLRGLQPIIYGDGEQKRCFSFVQDSVYCLLQLGTNPNIQGEVFNIGPDEEFVSINELAACIAEVIGFDLDPIYVPGRPQEVKLANCSSDRARKELGYCTTYTLRQGIEEMVAWIRKKGPKDFDYFLDLEIVNEMTPITWRRKLI